MPITKQAIKRMKQNEVAKKRNKHYGSQMKSMVKLLLTYIQEGELEKAKKILPAVVKTIDMAAKKNLIHENNASRKKSRIQKAVNTGVTKKAEPKTTKAKKVKKPIAKSTTPKKEEKPKEEVKKEVQEEPKKEAEKTE